jgi:hypothetical protein
LNRFLEISKVQIMKDLQNTMRNVAAVVIGPVQTSRLVCLSRGLVILARGLVILASGLVVVGPAMSVDTSLSRAQYREAVKDANASYQADLLQCNTKSQDEITPCRRQARAARTKALAAAKAQRAIGTDKSVDTSKPPNPEIPSGLKASKTDIEPKLQRDSPPDIVAPKKN